MKEKISGQKEREHIDDLQAEKKNYNDTLNAEAATPKEKGFIDKVKDKLPGQHKKT